MFTGVGEVCNVDSDCLAGDLEIQCVQNEGGQGYCTCPDGLTEFEGLCLTSGLGLCYFVLIFFLVSRSIPYTAG